METYLVEIAKQSLFLVLVLSGPPVVMALVVGLIVSVIQATTQIQEQTLTFVPKLVAIILVLAFMGPLGMAKVIESTKSLFINFAAHVN